MSNIFVKAENAISNLIPDGSKPLTYQAQPPTPIPGSPQFTSAIPPVNPKDPYSPRPVPSAWQAPIQAAYQKYPSLPKGIIESVLMKESSMGTANTSFNPKNGQSAWLAGLTPGATADLSKQGITPNLDTQEGAINATAAYLASRQSGTQPDGTPFKITDPSKLYFSRYADPGSNTPASRKTFNKYLAYYGGNQVAQKSLIPAKQSSSVFVPSSSLADNMQ